MKPFQKILVPVDFSPHSEQAVRVAADIARRYDGSLDVVYVYEPITYSVPEGYMLLSQEQFDDIFESFREQLATVKAMAEASGAPRVETHLLEGPAAAMICATAEEKQFDQIVMGTHGRGGLRHLFLGSVAERVLRLAPCPVLTIKAPSQKEHQS
jgi:universal stress protein A